MGSFEDGTFLGRVWCPEAAGPLVVLAEDGIVYDITSIDAPTTSDLLEADEPLDRVVDAQRRRLMPVEELMAVSLAGSGDRNSLHLIAPCDLQAVKACGVTFARSMLERVIEEKAGGDPLAAGAIRNRVAEIVGTSLNSVRPGSDDAEKLKCALISEGMWSQYLEVGIGPDAEVFTKAQVLSSVGWGAKIGLHPSSSWNNPEPEIVLAIDSKGRIKGATLGNDVNLRDVEGRSALLLGKAKDNNASCALGPFIRLFDSLYTLDDVREADVTLEVIGKDGFVLRGSSTMKEISRDPLDLVSQTINEHHQYPDGLMLFMGTLFAPTEDRGRPGLGFTHEIGDVVNIGNDQLGSLSNTVDLTSSCPPWTFGIRELMANLAGRGLLRTAGT